MLLSRRHTEKRPTCVRLNSAFSEGSGPSTEKANFSYCKKKTKKSLVCCNVLHSQLQLKKSLVGLKVNGEQKSLHQC